MEPDTHAYYANMGWVSFDLAPENLYSLRGGKLGCIPAGTVHRLV